MFQDEVAAAGQQDVWRSARMFVGGLNRALNGDQSYAYTDAYLGNAPNQFYAVGPYGTSVEGLPVTTAANGAVVISPGLVLVALGAAAVLLFKRG